MPTHTIRDWTLHPLPSKVRFERSSGPGTETMEFIEVDEEGRVEITDDAGDPVSADYDVVLAAIFQQMDVIEDLQRLLDAAEVEGGEAMFNSAQRVRLVFGDSIK